MPSMEVALLLTRVLQVRCDGNKSGCIRCSEKRLPCQYSESRVGKVVGKRRKRPVDDSIGMINSEAWVLNNYLPPQSLPSPAATNTSDERFKRSCTTSSWASLIATDEQSPPNLGSPEDYFQSLDLSDCRRFSFTSELPMIGHNGLPTPALSPPQIQFLSPMALEARPASRQNSLSVDNSHFRPPTRPVSAYRTPEPQASDDDEMVCIKLLGHLKKHSVDEQQTLECTTDLIRKSTAAVRRILKGKNARADYACHLLLSNIMMHIVDLCERSCRKQMEENYRDSQFPENPQYDSSSEYFATNLAPGQSQEDCREALGAALLDTLDVSTLLADLLKRKPLNGFQTLGRHESLHLALEQRLKASLASLVR